MENFVEIIDKEINKRLRKIFWIYSHTSFEKYSKKYNIFYKISQKDNSIKIFRGKIEILEIHLSQLDYFK